MNEVVADYSVVVEGTVDFRVILTHAVGLQVTATNEVVDVAV
jgi:hypothetical protein